MSSSVRGFEDESYEEFYSHWVDLQVQQIEELKSALEGDMREHELRKLVDEVHTHYEYFYSSNISAAKQNILQMISSSWRTSLEKAFMWIGGWRPTMFVQLAYALAGQHVEAELAELLEGTDSPSMGALTGRQLASINKLQMKIIDDEKRLSKQLAMLQQSMADEPLLSLAQVEDAVEAIASCSGDELMQEAVKQKLKVLEDNFVEANHVRVNALAGMLEILTTFQSAQFLMSLGQLQAAFRKLGGYDTIRKHEGAASASSLP